MPCHQIVSDLNIDIHSNLTYINMQLYQLSLILIRNIGTDFLPYITMQIFASYINNFLFIISTLVFINLDIKN